MADTWDPAAFGLVPVGQQAAPTTSSPSWDPAQFGLTPVQSAPAPAPAPSGDDRASQPDRQSRRPRLIDSTTVTPEQADQISAGIGRSVNDLIDRPAQWLAQGADALGLTSGQGEAVAASNTAGRQAYETQHGADPYAEFGRGVGQFALAYPVAGALGKVAGAGADMLAAGAGRVSPLLGNIVQGTTDFLSGNAGGARFLPRTIQAASTAAGGAVQGGLAAGLTAGQSDAPIGQQVKEGATVGAIVAPVARAVTGGVTGAKNAVLGGDMNPEVAALAKTARVKYGIDLTGDSISPSPFVRTLGSQLEQVPLTGMAEAKQAARQQFTKAVASTIGEDAEHVTPVVMERAVKRIGGVMNDVAAKTGVPVGQHLADELQDIARSSMGAMPASERPLLQRQISDVLDMAKNNGGVIPGEGYQTLTNYRSNIATSLRSGTPSMKEFSGRLKDALESSLERAAVASGDTSAIDALKEARRQYKAVKTIEPLVTKGEPGEITPNRLLTVVDRSYKGRGLRANQPDLGELADIGQRFNLVPDSGTARRTAALAAMGTLGSAATQLASGQTGNALMTAAAIPGAMLGGRLASNYLRSPSYINSLLNKTAITPAAGQMNSLLQYGVPLSVIEQGRMMGR